jgi:hypothetical protein
MRILAIAVCLLSITVPGFTQTFTLDAVSTCPGLGDSQNYLLLGQTYYVEWVSGSWSPFPDESYQGGYTWESTVSYYDYGTGQTGVIGSPVPGFYQTPQEAEAAARGIYPIVGHGTVVSFYMKEVGPSSDVCDDNRGSVTLRFIQPTPVETPSTLRTELLANVPNPFNPATAVRFTLAQSEHVRIDVYDSAGKFVKNLVDEVRSAGPQQAAWNGTDANDRRVASGVYFVRMSTRGEEFTRKIVLLK